MSSKQNKNFQIPEHLYDISPGFLFSIDSRGMLIQMNRAFLRRLDIENTDLDQRSITEFLTVGSKIFFQTHFLPLVTMQGSVNEIFLSFKSSAAEIPVLFNAVSESKEGVLTIHCAGLEISNRNRFEKELLEAKKIAEAAVLQNSELLFAQNLLEENQKLLEVQFRNAENMLQKHHEIFKVISHDLQEPLRKSVMFAGVLLSKSSNLDESAREKIEKIIKSNERMRYILMTVQRYEELDNRALKFSLINLPTLIAAAFKSTNSNEDDFDLKVKISCPDFAADAVLIENMLSELFVNSVKARKPSQKIKITITAVVVKKNIFQNSKERYSYGNFVKITFTDNGFGIRNDAGIFNIIKQSNELDGFGLGLAFTKKIVLKHHGSITAKSNATEGITFTIYLPIAIS